MVDPQEHRSQLVAGRTIAMDRLAVRERSRGELFAALARRNIDEDVALAVVDQLQADGFVDDERFARAWVESRSRSKGLARSVLRLELRTKQVAEETINLVLAEVDPADEIQAAHRLVQRKLRSVQGLDQSVQLRRLTAMLARKGFGPQIAVEVVRAELAFAAEQIESI